MKIFFQAGRTCQFGDYATLLNERQSTGLGGASLDSWVSRSYFEQVRKRAVLCKQSADNPGLLILQVLCVSAQLPPRILLTSPTLLNTPLIKGLCSLHSSHSLRLCIMSQRAPHLHGFSDKRTSRPGSVSSSNRKYLRM